MDKRNNELTSLNHKIEKLRFCLFGWLVGWLVVFVLFCFVLFFVFVLFCFVLFVFF